MQSTAILDVRKSQPPACFVQQTAAEYFADETRRSHSETEWFIDDPQLYHGRRITKEWAFEGNDATEFGTVVHDVILGAAQVKYGPTNYRPRTIACFRPSDVPKRRPTFVSGSGSRYWIEKDRVIREADHWGTVGTCYWALRQHGAPITSSIDTGRYYGPWTRQAGYCKFEHFMPARSFLPVPPSALTLDGKRFGGRWNEFIQANENEILLTEKQFEVVPWMLEEIKAHPFASKLLFGPGGRNEQVIHWSDFNGAPMRSRLDRLWMPGGLSYVIDYKTTQRIDRNGFSQIAREMGYFRQAAHYLRAAWQATGDTAIAFVFVAQLKKPPYTVETFISDEESLGEADEQNCQAALDIAKCEKTGIWRDPEYGQLKTISSTRPRFKDQGNGYSAAAAT